MARSLRIKVRTRREASKWYIIIMPSTTTIISPVKGGTVDASRHHVDSNRSNYKSASGLGPGVFSSQIEKRTADKVVGRDGEMYWMRLGGRGSRGSSLLRLTTLSKIFADH